MVQRGLPRGIVRSVVGEVVQAQLLAAANGAGGANGERSVANGSQSSMYVEYTYICIWADTDWDENFR